MKCTKIIHQADALIWLENQEVFHETSIITSMPDYTEFPRLSLDQWKNWFTGAAKLILQKK